MKRIDITPQKGRLFEISIGIIFLIAGIYLMGEVLLKFLKFTAGVVLFFIGLSLSKKLWMK